MWVLCVITSELQKTTRREAREGYVRFLLSRDGIEAEDIEEYLTTKQAELEDRSIIEMIYSGDYDRAVQAVETFLEELED